MYYAGIGSRETPETVLRVMYSTALALSNLGYTLRSGGAPGADTAFEMGAVRKEIFIPWNGFNGRQSPPCLCIKGIDLRNAMEMAAEFHPAWHRCSPAARKLHARNCFQVLGKDLSTPVDFVICWTKDGGPTGGTGQAIRIAMHHRIPVFNLFNPEDIKSLEKLIRDKLI